MDTKDLESIIPVFLKNLPGKHLALKRYKRIIVRSNLFMKFPTPEGVAATPLRVATWQVYSVDFFSVSMVEMKSFDPLNCLLRKKPTEPPQGYPIGRRRLSCFDKGSASPCQ